MKELTIEQKAKAYDEAIAHAKILLKTIGNATLGNLVLKNEFENMFPELKESKNENDKCMLNNIIDTLRPLSGTTHSGYTINSMIAWLKKQQNPIDKIQLGKNYKCIASPRYTMFMIGEIYKPEDKFLCSLMNFCSDCFEPIEDGERKHTDKVEPKFKVGNKIKLAIEPKYPAREIIAIRDDAYYFDERVYLPFSRQDEWELVEQKPVEDRYMEGYLNGTNDALKTLKSDAWSEEDLYKIEHALFGTYAVDIATRILNKIKSLRPQSQWRPSDEQMKALSGINVTGCISYIGQGQELINLYNDLKRLLKI